MDNYRFKYQDAIKDKIKEHLKTASFESLDEVRSELADRIFSSLTIVAEHLNWPNIDRETFESYFEVVRKEVQSNHVTTIKAPNLLSKNKSTWLNDSRENEITWNYTERYLEYLRGQGRSESVVEEIKNSSYKILSKLADPKSQSSTFIKGLVDGDVQSGKTGNFNAVINRALDSGYKLIIVLSGIMDDLRSQTQARIDKDVIGNGKGVGLRQAFGHQGDESVFQVISITSEDADFNRPLANADFSLNQINIMVCKKNVSILKNILLWLKDNLPKGATKHSLPLLIIDDEADNASLNNEGHKGQNYASKINGHIRAILGIFHKKSYLGYTATPFANVIQDRNSASEEMWSVLEIKKDESKKKSKKITEHLFEQVDNLFPDDFIFLLDTPTNYIGAHRIFETLQPSKKLPVVFDIDDYTNDFPSRVMENGDDIIGVERYDNKQDWESKVGKFGHYLNFTSFSEYKKGTRASKSVDNFPIDLPNSIKDAVMCFVLGIAVRETRRKDLILSKVYQPHNTMLVHISRFTSWQNKSSKLINDFYNDIETRLKMDKPNGTNSIYRKFEKVWSDYHAETVGSIHSHLPDNYVDDYMQPVSFDSISPLLVDAVSNIEVLALNSATGKELKYKNEKPRKVIAIGGNRLSRGFTLEGLTVSYFVRSTNYSDSLLQMGRWFGYRPGYLDCCKLFTSRDLISKYNSTSLCIDELKEEFKKMDQKGATPREFELRVRKHPGVLQITRPTILKNAISIKWSYQDSLIMTTELDITKEKISKVWADFTSKVSPLFSAAKEKDSLLAITVTSKELIKIIESNNNFDETRNNLIKQYVNKCVEKNLLTSWTIAIKLTGSAAKESGIGILTSDETGLPKDVQLAVRSGPVQEKGNHFYDEFIKDQRFKPTGSSANIMSGGTDMKVALEEDQILLAEKEFISQKVSEILKNDSNISEEDALIKAQGKTKPERIYREKLTQNQGVLIFYLLDPYYVFNQVPKKVDTTIQRLLKERGQLLNEPLVGMAMGFPPISRKLDPYGEYVKGDYDLEILDEDEDEASDELLPTDAVL
ncbi:Z1 domain-containing protein [Shewanella ulleungensis]|uniref:Z1 domain-containing protein n=1 Tax=Shewanella ulleungensis TaxID=2282699 RepID=UPI003D7A3C6A